MDVKVEHEWKVALKKRGRPRNVGGQQLKAKEEGTLIYFFKLQTAKKKIEEMEAMEKYANGSYLDGKKCFGPVERFLGGDVNCY